MKRHLSLVLIFAFSVFVFAQNTLSGVIKNNAGDPVASASVTVEEPGKDAIIAYSISNAKGEYKVSFTTSSPTVDVKIKAFNHKTISTSVKNENQKQNFTLQTQATEIEEVKLKTKLITKRGDTISYDLKAFANKNDRTLADVLGKMPGIEVNKDGSILYQGEPLSKFYVNGKDLMEGGYGVVNKALPKDAVRKVEVLENHQPIKMLQDKVPSDQAALNVVLKNKVTMTGRGEVGAGYGDDDNFLWNVKLTPMFFGQKNQWVVNYKTNNTGEAVENEGNFFGSFNRWEGRRGNASQNKWLSVETASTPSLPEEKYLFNNVHFLSANVLTNPFKNKEWELKLSGSYTNNAVERESVQERYDKQFGTTSFPTRRNNFYTNRAKGEINFTKNAKKGFFKNVTTFNQFWNTDRATISIADLNNNTKESRQSVESPTSSFQNSLSAIIPWKEKMLNVKSYISYQDDQQTLDILPGDYVYYPKAKTDDNNLFEGTSKLTENFSMKTLEANHSATMAFSKKMWTFTPEVGFNYQMNEMNSELFANNGSINYGQDFANDLNFVQSVPYAALGVEYQSNSWRASLRLPTNFTNITMEDPARGLDKDFSKTTFEPSGFVQYSFASFWKATASGNINYNFANVNDAYAGLIMSNASSVAAPMDPQNPVSESLYKGARGRVEYRNPLNNLFFNVNYAYSKNKNNLLGEFKVDELGFGTVEYIERDNFTTSNTERVEIGKYFPSFKSNVSFSFNNSVSTSEGIRNEDLYTNTGTNQSLGFKFNNSHFSWMSMDYNFSLGWGKNESEFSNTKSNSYNHNLNMIFYPVENHSLGLNWDQINNNQGGQKFTNGFYDLTYQFAWSKKNIDFELKWINIANKKAFEIINDGAFITTTTRMQIRPSQVMFTVKFNFK